MWVLVTTAWSVLGLRTEKRPPIWRVAEELLNIEYSGIDGRIILRLILDK